jgi:hypothetical protein
METPDQSHLNAAKRILRYIKGTINEGMFYTSSTNFNLVGYSDSDWGRDLDERKSTTGFVFFMGDTSFTWSSKKQSIVTLSSCEAEYVAANSAVCHLIWLRHTHTHSLSLSLSLFIYFEKACVCTGSYDCGSHLPLVLRPKTA